MWPMSLCITFQLFLGIVHWGICKILTSSRKIQLLEKFLAHSISSGNNCWIGDLFSKEFYQLSFPLIFYKSSHCSTDFTLSYYNVYLFLPSYLKIFFFVLFNTSFLLYSLVWLCFIIWLAVFAFHIFPSGFRSYVSLAFFQSSP